MKGHQKFWLAVTICSVAYLFHGLIIPHWDYTVFGDSTELGAIYLTRFLTGVLVGFGIITYGVHCADSTSYNIFHHGHGAVKAFNRWLDKVIKT